MLLRTIISSDEPADTGAKIIELYKERWKLFPEVAKVLGKKSTRVFHTFERQTPADSRDLTPKEPIGPKCQGMGEENDLTLWFYTFPGLARFKEWALGAPEHIALHTKVLTGIRPPVSPHHRLSRSMRRMTQRPTLGNPRRTEGDVADDREDAVGRRTTWKHSDHDARGSRLIGGRRAEGELRCG